MASVATLKALGLNFSPNYLEVPEGSMLQANNVVIRRDNVLEKRRGFKLYGNSFGGASDRAKQISSYKDRLLRHYSNKLQFDNGSGVFTNLAGTYLETQTGLRIKSIERNGNYYFTTSEGIQKLSVKNSGELSSTTAATKAGGIRALDATAQLEITPGDQSSFFTQDSVVGYRHLFGTKDANSNLVLGSPSPKTDIYNPLSQLISLDYNRLLVLIDDLNNAPTIGATIIASSNYASTLQLSSTATGFELQTAITSLATKLDDDIVYTSGALNTASASIDTTTSITLTFNNPITTFFSVGDRVRLTGFSQASLLVLNNNDFDITSVSGSTITADIFGSNVLTTTTTQLDTGGTVTSRVFIKAITTPSAVASDPVLPIPDPITDPTTDNDLLSIQFALEQISIKLQAQLSSVIAAALITAFLSNYQLTKTAKVKYTLTLPEEITSSYFVQLYRSDIKQALDVTVLGTLTADDEMRLVYEAYPTTAELAARQMIIEDIVPQGFEGANLYSNQFTGEGIAQANTPPPFAKDINGFKGYVFYANTKLKNQLLLNFLGVTKLYYSQDITAIPTGGPTITVTANTTDLVNGDTIVISGSDSTPTIDGVRAISNVTSTGFDITLNQNITIAGTLGTWFKNKNTSINIIQGSTVENYTFALGAPEITIATCPAGSAFTATGTADYFIFYSGQDQQKYYVWFYVDGATPPTDPAIANAVGIKVVIDTTFTSAQVAAALSQSINTVPNDFKCSVSGSNATIVCTLNGYTTATTLNTFPGTILQDSIGQGEDATIKQVLLSTQLSPARSIDETTKSLVRVINKQTNGIVYAYYEFDPRSTFSGKFTLEAKDISSSSFYIQGSNSDIGSSFNPDISPIFSGITSTLGSPTIINWTAHGLITGDKVVISDSDISAINGVWSITYVSANSFSIPVITIANATTGNISKSDDAIVSSDVEAKNRIYYSKYQQPEAVPLVNYIDIGPADKEILRIIPLRDSLFIYKEDGLYRLSSETAPFNVALFDTSCIMVAPDSAGIANNVVFVWASQGIVTTSEAGVNVISRAIDSEILKLASDNYPAFKTATWGTGYETDSAYIVSTISQTSDTYATLEYRYSTLTNTWTTWDLPTTCGYVNPVDEKVYLGAGDTNFISQERKSFSRIDYADREFTKHIEALNYSIENINGYNIGTLKQGQINDFSIGDAIVQEQTLTVYDFNTRLQKIDTDPSSSLSKNYYSTLKTTFGENLRTKIEQFAAKLDLDPLGFSDYAAAISNYSGSILTSSIASSTVITTSAAHNLVSDRQVTISGHSGSSPDINGVYTVTVLSPTTFSIPIAVNIPGTGGTFSTNTESFQDMKACYNEIASKMNNDPNISFSNYATISNITYQESIVIGINKPKNQLTLSAPLEYIEGDFTVYKSINSITIYSPHTFGDPLGIKHLRESTIMLADKKFTEFDLSFSTDLIPGYQAVTFTGDGTGTFGAGSFGYNYFGGVSHSAPLRTYVPRQHQRCRFLNVKLEHAIARENVSIYGITITGEIGLSSRGYR